MGLDGSAIATAPDKPMMTVNQVADIAQTLVNELEDDYATDPSGRRILPNVDFLVADWPTKVKNNYSQVAVVGSSKKNGMGKSGLLYWMAKATMKERFTFEKNFFFQGNLNDIKAQTDTMEVGDLLCLDEIVRLWYKRKAMSRETIDLNEWMAADQRKTQVALAGAVPDFHDLDSYATKGKVDDYIEVVARGIGIWYKADHFPKTDPWHTDMFEKIAERRMKAYRGDSSLSTKIELLRRHPCFHSLVFWKKMPWADEKIYKKLVIESALKADGKVSDNDAMSIMKRELEDKYKTSEAKAWKAVINMMDFMGKNAPFRKSVILKEAGIDIYTYNKWEKELMKVEGPKIVA